MCLLDDTGSFFRDIGILGSCSPPVKEGGNCQFNFRGCEKGLRCDTDRPPNQFETDFRGIGNSSCRQKGKEGDFCSFQQQGTPSLAERQNRIPKSCEDGLICLFGTCSLPKQLNERCSGTSTCADGFYCQGPASDTCQPNVGLGQQCPIESPFRCINGFCSPRDGTFFPSFCIPFRKENEKCGTCEKDLICTSGFYKDGICVKEENLLRRRNLPCDPKADRCDGFLDLICEAREDGPVCRTIII